MRYVAKDERVNLFNDVFIFKGNVNYNYNLRIYSIFSEHYLQKLCKTWR